MECWVQDCPHGIKTTPAKSQIVRQMGSNPSRLKLHVDEGDYLGDVRVDQLEGEVPRFGKNEKEEDGGLDTALLLPQKCCVCKAKNL